jgi:hypothetical protein
MGNILANVSDIIQYATYSAQMIIVRLQNNMKERNYLSLYFKIKPGKNNM